MPDVGSLYPDDDIRHYFLYAPNKAADIFFLVLFALLAIAIAIQSYRKRQWWLQSLTLMAAMESAGYLARIVLIESPNGNAFKAELVILILAPNLLALCCYILLGKIITYVFHTRADGKTDNWLIRHPKWVPYFYLCSDIICIAIQGVGGAILSGATTQSQLNTGKAVEVVGLAAQLFFVATFVLIVYYIWRTMRAQSAELSRQLNSSYLTLVVVIGLLVLRNIYRTIEFSTGGFTSGYFQENESWYLVFDPTLMSLALMIVIGFDFTRRLPADCLNPPKTTSTSASTELTTVQVVSDAGVAPADKEAERSPQADEEAAVVISTDSEKQDMQSPSTQQNGYH